MHFLEWKYYGYIPAFYIYIRISLKFVPKGPMNNISTLVQIMAWRLPGDKPLSEPMMVSLLTHICVTRPQWNNGCNYLLLRVCLSFFGSALEWFSVNLWWSSWSGLIKARPWAHFANNSPIVIPIGNVFLLHFRAWPLYRHILCLFQNFTNLQIPWFTFSLENDQIAIWQNFSKNASNVSLGVRPFSK